MTIASDVIRCDTKTSILKDLLKKDSYSYEINKSILEKTKGLYELKEAILYTAFRRLEQSGAITSYWYKVSGVLYSDFELNRHSDLYIYKNSVTNLYLSTTSENLITIKNNHYI